MPFLTNNIIASAVPIVFVSFLMASTDTGAEALNPPEQRSSAGFPVLVMSNDAQAASGLKTVTTVSVENHSEYQVAGKVISIEPLLALKERYLVAQAELKGTQAKLKQASESLKRLQDLFKNGVTAKRSLQEQQALVLSDEASADAAQVKLTAIAHETRLLWGDLADWILSGRTDRFAAFLSGKQFLLQIILPNNKKLDSGMATIFVEANGDRSKAFPATLISRAIQADSAISGESFFFKTTGDKLRIGMKLQAWIPQHPDGRSGVVAPESALLWYMDQVYVYIKNSDEHFYRRQLNKFSATAGGYFIPEDIKPGEEIVITGGQMLLSEELKGQIPDED